jgi:citrate lyase beta subunit
MIHKRVRRSLLFMPGDDFKKISKGAALDVDAVIMDLEDGVAMNRKEEARQTVLRALQELDFARTERLVRINPPVKGLQAEDIAATIYGQPDGYVLPKLESARELQQVAHTIWQYELTIGIDVRSTRLLAIIETAKGIANLREIAQADERLDALVFGAEDLVGSIGAVRSEAGSEVFYARSAVVIHAAAFELQAIDTPYITLRDEDGLRADAMKAMHMGYTGKLAIHPEQVPIISEVFTPTDSQIKQAKDLIAAHDEYQASGTGVFVFKGKMVDMPMIRAAERVLEKARAAGKY